MIGLQKLHDALAVFLQHLQVVSLLCLSNPKYVIVHHLRRYHVEFLGVTKRRHEEKIAAAAASEPQVISVGGV